MHQNHLDNRRKMHENQPNKQSRRQADRQTDRQTGRVTGRDRQSDRQRDKTLLLTSPVAWSAPKIRARMSPSRCLVRISWTMCDTCWPMYSSNSLPRCATIIVSYLCVALTLATAASTLVVAVAAASALALATEMRASAPSTLTL